MRNRSMTASSMYFSGYGVSRDGAKALRLMTKSTKAALLSGLVFPGIGHFVLKQYLRGSILMLVALMAMSAIVRIVFQQAQAIVDRHFKVLSIQQQSGHPVTAQSGRIDT